MTESPLNWRLVQQLIQKDWYFLRKSLVVYLAVGAFGAKG